MTAREDHVAAGWSEDGRLRWIEAGVLRLDEEDKDGATVVHREHREQVGWLSSNELAGLVRHLAGWFAEDPSETIDEIEAAAQRVHDALETWNDRARSEEEHPPYDDLTRVLAHLVVRCKRLREDVGKFSDKKSKIITVDAAPSKTGNHARRS